MGCVFGVGSVATAGMMQELKMQTRGTWSLTVMLSISLSRITASVRTVRLGNRDFNQRIFTDIETAANGGLPWPLFKLVVKYGMSGSLSWSFSKMEEETSKLIIHYCVSFQLTI